MMYHLIAEKIQKSANVFLVVGSVGWVLVGFFCSYEDSYSGGWNLPLLIGMVLGGLLLHYGVWLILCGFAYLIDCLEKANRNLDAIRASSEKPGKPGGEEEK